MSPACEVCASEKDLKKCSACKGVFYCCVEHQKQHWHQHKAACRAACPARPNRTPPANSGASTALPPPPVADAWANGLDPAQQREWLIDCYRMRLDDDYAWGGGNLHGIYDVGSRKVDVVLDFLVFCKLAARCGAVPRGWDWPAFLAAARGLLPYAFEKSDAQEKYGSENVFAVLTGGRSLRATGEAIYGTSAMNAFAYSPEHASVQREIEERLTASLAGDPEVFAAVGGGKLWRQFLKELRLKPARRM